MIQGELSLRPATEDDLSAIVEIERKSHRAPWTLEHFKAELEKPYSLFWVLTDDETDEVIAAYSVAHQLEKLLIQNIVVAPDFRRKGLASHVLRKLDSHALKHDIGSIRLEVRRSNEAAVALYQAHGFNICQMLRQFYSDGEDAYVMEKQVIGDTLPKDI